MNTLSLSELEILVCGCYVGMTVSRARLLKAFSYILVSRVRSSVFSFTVSAV